MRILVVSSDFPPTLGGIARLSYSSAIGLADLGHTIRVIATESKDCEAFDKSCPLSIRRVSNRKLLREVSMYIALAQEIRSFRPDIVWSALWFPCAWLVSLQSQRYPFRQVFSTYGSEVIPNLKAGWKQWLKAQLTPLRSRVFAKSDWIFTLSRYTQREVVALGADLSKTSILPGGVESSWFSIDSLPKDPSKPVILTVARLDEHKGHDMVLRALPALCRDHPGLRYRIVGPDTGGWARLSAIVEELGLESHVQYCGRLSEEDLRKCYAEATAFIMPSRDIPGRHVEGFGLTFLEANAVGLPVVGGRSGGVPDAIEDGVSGYLVDPTSPEEIGAALRSLLENPEQAQRLGQQGRARALRAFTWRAIAETMEARFRDLLDTGRPL